MSNRLSVAYSIALAVVLALLAGPAAALGLGQIVVKSKPGQPLLAEIPVISNDPAELEQLQARMASPETFRRIGLEPPTGAASDLQFAVALDARGNQVIRVTSTVPIRQPLLTFLIEVDWGQGRLVREYSALVDAPRTVAAPTLPPIQAPVVAPSNTIVRPIPIPIPAPVAVVPPPPAVVPVPTPAPAPTARPVTAIPSPVTEPPPVPVAVAPAASPSSEYGPVRAGQTLSQIVGQLDTAPGYTSDQTMLALLRTNPEAFIGDDINRLKQGAVLRMPQASELSRYSATQAAAVVREQIENWRQARRPTPQPAAVATASPTPGARQASSGSKTAPHVSDARLEIVPPSASNGRRAGTRSGIDAGGEGNMLRQQLQETNETLAARNAEV
ncbi:MAG TPA: FimV/HubP family polar landmark protein, partial [Luteimonas sp.]|nr:FimV/HubP family polar landmark protein [Luteimonas sp.]